MAKRNVCECVYDDEIKEGCGRGQRNKKKYFRVLGVGGDEKKKKIRSFTSKWVKCCYLIPIK